MSEHTDIPAGEIHTPYQWIVADATALAAITPAAGDIHKLALQLDTKAVWRLESTSPVTWGASTLWGNVGGKPSTFPPSTHGHAVSDVAGLQAALDDRPTSATVAAQIAALVASSPAALDTLNELAAALGNDPNFSTTVVNSLAGKVDKVTGKGLSESDFTSAEKSKLAGISAGATANDTDANLKNRANHTGTQPMSTVEGLESALGAVGKAYPPGYIYGLTLSNNASDPTNDIDIAAGSARGDANLVDIDLASVLTKRLDATWAVGTGNGGLDTGTIADGTYHVFLIKRSDTGVVDALFSTSPSAPVMPANYNSKRRIGSILRESGAIVLFDQYGDVFKRKSQVVIRDSTAVVTDTLLYMKVPTGIKTSPLFFCDCRLSSAGQLIQIMGDGDRPSAEVSVNRVAGTEYSLNVITGHFTTNTAGQLRFTLDNSAGTASFARLMANGWTDGRGK